MQNPDEYFQSTLTFFDVIENIWRDILNDKITFIEGKQRFYSLIIKYSAMEQKYKINTTVLGKGDRLLATAFNDDHRLFRKFLKFLISLDNENVINSLETHYVSQKNCKGFFILLDEFTKANKDTSSLIKTFLDLIHYNDIKVDKVNHLAVVLGKPQTFIIESLIDNYSIQSLFYYLNESFFNKDTSLVKDYSAVLYEKRDLLPATDYVALMALLISYNSEASAIFLKDDQDSSIVEEYILASSTNFIRYIEFLKNYSTFLSDERLALFEKNIFTRINAGAFILNYAKVVEKSSKREALKKLLVIQKSYKFDGYIVDFLKHFPKYNHLLMML